jgi:hypothetical protein
MALEKKSVHVRLDFDLHQALLVLKEVDGLTCEKWCERVVTRAIRERVHAASVLTATAARLGITGIERAEPSNFGELGS